MGRMVFVSGESSGVSVSIVGELPQCCEFLRDLGRGKVIEVDSERLTGEVKLATSRVHRSFGYFNNFKRRNCNCGIPRLRAGVNRVLNIRRRHGAILVKTNGLKGTIYGGVFNMGDNFGLVNVFSGGRTVYKGVVGNVPVEGVSRLRGFYVSGGPVYTIVYVPSGSVERLARLLVGRNIGDF